MTGHLPAFIAGGGLWWIAGIAAVGFALLLGWALCRTAALSDHASAEARRFADHERVWAVRDAQIQAAVDEALSDAAWVWPASSRHPERTA